MVTRPTAIRNAVQQMLELEATRTRDAAGRLLTRVSRKSLEAQPELEWNAFVALLATAGYGDLAPSQRPAWLVFQYEAEVQNGGHTLYFDVHEGQRLEETTLALRALGVDQHAVILLEACQRWEAKTGDATFSDLDEAFSLATPTLTSALERCLAAQQGDFVLLEDA